MTDKEVDCSREKTEKVSTGFKKIKDITGQRFGCLTAVRRLDEKCWTSYLWLCRCDCGNEVKASVSNLTAGHIKSCGCMKKSAGARSAKDVRGKRYGMLVALEPTDKRADGGSIVWKCRCDCGNEAEISLKRLNHGGVRSCGCMSSPQLKDYVGKRFGRLTVIGYFGKNNPNSTEHYWTCRCDCGTEKNIGQSELQSGNTVSCGCYQKERVLDSLKLVDNTSVTILKHCKNIKANNKSGYTGVFQEKTGKWIAYISFKKKRYWLGRFDNKEDAIKARQRGEEMHDKFLEWYAGESEKIQAGKADESRRTAPLSEKRA